MQLHRIADGRLLGDGMHADRDHVADPGGAIPAVRHPQHSGSVRLLHERHYHGLYRRPDPRHRYRTLQSASTDRSYRDEDARL